MKPQPTAPLSDAARYQSAVTLYSNQRFSEALAAVQPLFQRHPARTKITRASASNLAGVCALNLEKLADAETFWQRAIEAMPDFAEPHCNLGSLFKRLNRLTEAEASFRKALACRPEYVDAHYNLGLLLHHLRRLPEAEAAYKKALEFRPNLALAHNNLGALLHELRRLPEAQAAYAAAVANDPRYAEAYFNIGRLLVDLKRLTEAEVVYRTALVLQPGLASAHHHLGSLLHLLTRFTEAEASLRHALTLAPQDADIHLSLSSTLLELDRSAHAEEACRSAIAIRADHANAHSTLAIILNRLGRQQEAETAYRRALEIQPGLTWAKFGLAVLLLEMGRYAEGWPLYEARHERLDGPPRSRPPELSCPQWQGEALHGKSLLLWFEQGFGDAVQFGRYIALLKAQGAAHITFACPPALSRLFASVDGIDAVLESHAAVAQGRYDYWTFLLSVPLHLGDSADFIPPANFLVPDPDCVNQWRGRLDSLRGRKIGLVWKGNPRHINDHNRSLPSLQVLAPLWGLPDTSFVSLQKGAGEDEAASPPAGQPVLHLGADIADFADTAAVVSQLDLVICVDTAVAHLAGALGTPCWIMLPAADNEWRWTRASNGPASRWYPDSMLAFRQSEAGNWTQVASAMRDTFERMF
jgi:tetratricopeptide (TPR) repeat protein